MQFINIEKRRYLKQQFLLIFYSSKLDIIYKQRILIGTYEVHNYPQRLIALPLEELLDSFALFALIGSSFYPVCTYNQFRLTLDISTFELKRPYIFLLVGLITILFLDFEVKFEKKNHPLMFTCEPLIQFLRKCPWDDNLRPKSKRSARSNVRISDTN